MAGGSRGHKVAQCRTNPENIFTLHLKFETIEVHKTIINTCIKDHIKSCIKDHINTCKHPKDATLAPLVQVIKQNKEDTKPRKQLYTPFEF
jgi:hypothetical protein